MRTVSKTEMRLVKIGLGHVGGVAVLRFLSTYDRRGTNAGLDLQNSEERDCSAPHSAPRPPSDLLGQLLRTNESTVVKWGFNFYICMHFVRNYPVFSKDKYCVSFFALTRNQLSAWTCDKQHTFTYCTVCAKCQGLAILKIKKKTALQQLMHEFSRGILCTLQAVLPTAQGQGRFFHQYSAFMCFCLTARF